MHKLVLATHNKGKVAELRTMLGAQGIEVVGAGELGLPEPDETGGSFEANATLKAVAAAKASGLPALADDSGLCIPSLGGWPGVDTANWTKRGTEGLAEINTRLGADRRAESVCILALAQPDGTTELFEGRIPGQLVWPPRGENGFGYDPVFVPDHDGKRTYAEMSPEEKSFNSHRHKAFEAFSRILSA
jgi:XTP/dITP diphosphohydrolase